MRLYRLVRQGMKGRRGDTRLLRAVLTLSFLFITLASIVLSSIQLSWMQMRISRHGRFQVAAFEVGPDDLAPLCETASSSAKSVILGPVKDLGLLGTINPAFLDMGSLNLAEGRLPENPRELLLTRSALESLPGKKQLGDRIQLVLDLPHVADKAWQDYANLDNRRGGFLEGLEERMTAGDLADFEAWYQAQPGFREHYGDLDRMQPEQRTRLLRQFAVTRPSLYAFKPAGGTRREPFHLDDITLSLHYKPNAFELTGERWGAQKGETLDYGGLFERLIIAREYTIVGLLSSYTDQWAAGDFALPEAFVSVSSGEELMAAARLVEASHPDMPRYQPGNLVLLADNRLEARALFDRVLASRGDGRQPSYRIDQYTQAAQGSSLSVGRLSGIEEQSGQEVQLAFRVFSGEVALFWQGAVYRAPEQLLTNGRLRLPGLLPLPLSELTAENALNQPDLPLQMNRFTYPLEEDAGSALQRLMPALLSVITLAAVLQIFLTQLRRRSRRLALMKGLGMDKGQLARMLLMEAALLLAFALPLGAALGLLLSFGAVRGLSLLQEAGSIVMHVPLWPVVRGLLLGAVALFLGVLLPMVQAMRIPLSGAFEQPQKAPPRMKAGKAPRQLRYRHMIWRNARANPGRSLLGIALGVLILLSPLASLFLGFHAFHDYRREVVDKDRPDYVLSAPYGMNNRYLQEHLTRLSEEVTSLSRVEAWMRGQHIGLVANHLIEGESPILTSLYSQPGEAFGLPPAGVPGPEDEGQEKPDPGEMIQLPMSFYTTLWAPDPESALMADLAAQLDEGSLDKEAFSAGEEVILIIPRYRQTEKGLRLSSRLQDAGHFREDKGIAPGDELTFLTYKIDIKQDSKVTVPVKVKARVAGIIHDMALPGVWPLSDEGGSHLLLGSPRLLQRVYPQSASRMSPQQARWFRLSVKTFYPYNYGMTFIMAYASPQADRESGDVAMLNFARDHALDLKNYRSANLALHSGAVNSAMLIALLGSAVFLIALVIQASALASTVRQERKRFGILQSMGLSRSRLMGGQALYGLSVGLLCALTANLLLFALIVAVTALQLPEGVALMSQLRHATLRGYPFLAHGLICLAFILLSGLLHAWPLDRITRQTAISNIRD